MLEYCTAVFLARLCCGLVVLALSTWLQIVAMGIDSAFEGHPDGQLAFVMVFGPLFMNVIQAWIQDQYLKRSSRSRLLSESPESMDLAADVEGSQRDSL
jgi:hypothetical protein